MAEADPTGMNSRGIVRRWSRVLLFALLTFLCLWIFRFQVLHAIGAFLIRTDSICKADAMYVLGGAPYDRGTHASLLLRNGCTRIAYCTGSNISQSYKAEGRALTEADLSRSAAMRVGASPAQILPLPYGTSTWEEALGVLHHARSKGLDTILVVSTDFHTRRVGNVFRERFEGSGITVLVKGAPSSEYDADAWWNSEQGLLMVNNEYVKTLYYLIKH